MEQIREKSKVFFTVRNALFGMLPAAIMFTITHTIRLGKTKTICKSAMLLLAVLKVTIFSRTVLITQ